MDEVEACPTILALSRSADVRQSSAMRLYWAALVLFCLTPAWGQRDAVVIETQLGDIHVVLAGAKAPETVSNFLGYVDGGFYTGGRFHHRQAR